MARHQPDPSGRVSKRAYISRIAVRTGLPVRTVSTVYDGALAELMETMIAGNSLMLTGFGRFYPQKHRGHRVQFTHEPGGSGQSVIPGYTVLKFSAARQVSRRLDASAKMSGPMAEDGPGTEL